MKKIPLTQGKLALIDDEDFDLVSKHKWSVSNIGHNFYATTRSKDTKYMHRLVMNNPAGLEIDHINGDGLDNRKKNLRVCDRSRNSANRRNFKNSTGFRGVAKQSLSNTYQAGIWIRGKRIYLGTFKTPEEASLAYRKKYREEYGEEPPEYRDSSD